MSTRDADPSDPRPLEEEGAPPWAHSGTTGFDRAIVCALVDADSEAAAREIVEGLWPADFEDGFVEQKADDWMPSVGRFGCIHDQMGRAS